MEPRGGFRDLEPWEHREEVARWESTGRCREAEARFLARLRSYCADPAFWDDMAENAGDPGLELEYRDRARHDRESIERAGLLAERLEDYGATPEYLAEIGEFQAAEALETRLAQDVCR